MIGLVGCLMIGSSYGNGYTEYDLAELLLNKAIAEDLIEKRYYTRDEILEFSREHELFNVIDGKTQVSHDVVSKALSNYENIEIIVEKKEMTERKKTLNEILSSVKSSEPIRPYTIDQIQEMTDEEQFGKIGIARFEDKELVVAQEEGFMHGQSDLDKVTELVKVLAAHADKNGHAISLTGGGGTAVGVAYGETKTALTNDYQNALFTIMFYRDTPVFTNQEIDGVTYSFDENIQINNLFAGWHLAHTDMTFEEQDVYLEEREYMEEDVLLALYDALRTFDANNAELIFDRIVKDYRYSGSHKFKTDERNELFTINNRLIYKDDYRGTDGGHAWTDYDFEE